MSKSIIKGKFPYKNNDKKNSKKKKALRDKEREKLLRKQDKQLKMQCECNHLDSKKNKAHFKKNSDGTIQTCEICGGKMYATPEAIDEISVEQAKMITYTVFGLARNKIRFSDEMDKQITKTLFMVSRMPELVKEMKESAKDSSKKKKHKKNKNKKKNGSKRSFRINY